MRFLGVGALILIMLTSGACAHNPQGGILTAEEVTIDNWKQFEAQLRRDLPLGTRIEEIKHYLERLGFEENKLGLGYGYSPYDNTLQAWIHNIDRWLLVFTTNVDIRFFLTEGDKSLKRTKVDLWNIGP